MKVRNELKQTDNDEEFMVYILMTIKDYAIENGMDPDETIKIIAENMLSILKIATFNSKER